MIVYRICNNLYKNDLSGNGAKLFGGRWNAKGVAMLYASEHISLAVLEMLVHNQLNDFSVELSLMHILLPDAIDIKEINLNKLKNTWDEDISYTRYIGNEFIKSSIDIMVKVPSAVIHEEHNFLINPLHIDMKKVKITGITSFRTDKRLFSIK